MGFLMLAGAMLAIGGPSPSAGAGDGGLRGNWQSGCQPIGEGGRHGVVTRVKFHAGRVEAEAQVYATSACHQPTFKLNYIGSIRILRRADDSLTFNHIVRSIHLTPEAVEVVSRYNQPDDPGCGLTDWRMGIRKSVANRHCGPFSFPAKGTTLYDAAWLGGGTLRFGAFPFRWTNTNADQRPNRPQRASYRRIADKVMNP